VRKRENDKRLSFFYVFPVGILRAHPIHVDSIASCLRPCLRTQVGFEVVGLKRVRVGGIRLGKLPVGAWRPFYVNELIPNQGARDALVPLLSLDTGFQQEAPAGPTQRPPRGRQPQGRSKRDAVRGKT